MNGGSLASSFIKRRRNVASGIRPTGQMHRCNHTKKNLWRARLFRNHPCKQFAHLLHQLIRRVVILLKVQNQCAFFIYFCPYFFSRWIYIQVGYKLHSCWIHGNTKVAVLYGTYCFCTLFSILDEEPTPGLQGRLNRQMNWWQTKYSDNLPIKFTWKQWNGAFFVTSIAIYIIFKCSLLKIWEACRCSQVNSAKTTVHRISIIRIIIAQFSCTSTQFKFKNFLVRERKGVAMRVKKAITQNIFVGWTYCFVKGSLIRFISVGALNFRNALTIIKTRKKSSGFIATNCAQSKEQRDINFGASQKRDIVDE